MRRSFAIEAQTWNIAVVWQLRFCKFFSIGICDTFESSEAMNIENI